MERRVIIAIALSVFVLMGYQAYFAPKPVPSPVNPGTPPASSAPQPAAGSATPAPAVEPGGPTAAPVQVLVADSAARDILVETDAVRAVFSTAGATLKSWQLKRYPEAGQPLDLIPADLPESFARAFTLSTNDAGLSKTLALALFRPSAESLTLGSAPGTLSFEYRDVSGLNARKTFYFQPSGQPYVIKVEAAVDVNGTSRPVTIASGPALGLGYSPDGAAYLPARVVQFQNGKVARLSASDLQTQARYEGEFRYAGVQDQYFLTAAVPGTEPITINYSPITVPNPKDPTGAGRTFVAFDVTVPASVSLPYFMGPQDFDVLHAVDTQLVRTIDFGMFAWLVVPLLRALKWLDGFIQNYGWSIVALTVLINLAIFPLRHRSMVSMRKMQAVQPEIKAIQDRYAKYKVTDPERQKMNQEVMALYKQKGVNPAAGCVPMLLTLPVLFAFYALLSAAIELRGAPFLGWIHDLSRHDPLYIMPLLMGATQFLQMRMTPTTMDPIQQKMMMLMPVVLTVTLIKAPAGLALYWFVSNLLAIGQQYATNKMIGAPVRPPAPPKRVKAGSADAGKP